MKILKALKYLDLICVSNRCVSITNWKVHIYSFARCQTYIFFFRENINYLQPNLPHWVPYILHTFNIHTFLAVASLRLIVFPTQSVQGCQDRFMCKVKIIVMSSITA